MIISQKMVDASENRMPAEVRASRPVRRAPRPAAEPAITFSLIGGIPPSEETAAPPPPLPPAATPPSADTELIKRLSNLTFGGAKPSSTELERLIGNNDLVDEFWLQRALVAARPIMRVVLRDNAGRERGWATGFMVSPRLFLTNHHVFPSLDETANALVEANYVLDIAGNPAPSYRFAVRGDQFYYAFQDLDFALVAIEPLSQDGKTQVAALGYHRLNAQPNKIQEQECMTLIQHPGGERRQLSIRENQLVKITDSYLWYQSDTAPGSSGAPAFNDSFQVVALHHSGAAKRDDATGNYVLKDGRQVPSLDGIDESQVVWVANEGIRISVLCNYLTQNLHPDNPFVQELFAAMQGGDIIATALKGQINAFPPDGNEQAPVVVPTVQAAAPEQASPPAQVISPALTIPVQLNITLSVVPASEVQVPASGLVAAAITQEPAMEKALAALSHINVDRDYTNRSGYDAQFLGVPASLPTLTDETLVSKMADGTHVLPYEHFSVVVNKQRRLPLFTASNLDYAEKKRHPEPGKYARKDLDGTAQEVWIYDPRIPQQDQLPDRFYNADGGAFDKGHVVRRDDVCWGLSYKEVVRGNCDTFHVTNCTPQVAGFNRSNDGTDDWGDLENEIASQAKTEQLSIFAGPILADTDRTFDGKDDFGHVKVQVPKEFWKVVLANDNGRLAAYAFILQQNLTHVPLEFAVKATWKPFQVSIAELEARLIGFCFPPEVHAADRMAKG